MRKIVLIAVVLLSIFATASFAADKAYLAVASEGKAVTSNVNQLGGKTPFILFFDAKGGLVEAVANPFAAEQGAGPKLVSFIIVKGAKIFVAGTFGGNMKNLAKSKGLTLIESSGKVSDAVSKNIKK